MIIVTVMGNLGADATFVEGATGKPGRMNFSLAGTTGYGDNQKSVWFSCTKWGKGSDALMGILKKGTRVVVNGRLSTYDDKDGGIRLSLDVTDLSMASAPGSVSKGDPNVTKVPYTPRPKSSDQPFDDEIPF